MLYFSSSGVEVRQAKQVYEIFFKELQSKDEKMRRQLEHEEQKRIESLRHQQINMVSDDPTNIFAENLPT